MGCKSNQKPKKANQTHTHTDFHHKPVICLTNSFEFMKAKVLRLLKETIRSKRDRLFQWCTWSYVSSFALLSCQSAMSKFIRKLTNLSCNSLHQSNSINTFTQIFLIQLMRQWPYIHFSFVEIINYFLLPQVLKFTRIFLMLHYIFFSF